MVGLLRGRALSWAHALSEREALHAMTTEEFMQQLEQVFDRPDHATNAGGRLFTLRQGNRSAAEYAVEFRLGRERCPCKWLGYTPGLN